MQCPDQQPNGLTQPNLLSFPARSRRHLGNVGLVSRVSDELRRCAYFLKPKSRKSARKFGSVPL
jgi:hypothetical protein